MRIKHLEEGPLEEGPNGHRTRPSRFFAGPSGDFAPKTGYRSIDDLQQSSEKAYHAGKKLDDLKALGPPEAEGFNYRKYMDLLKAIVNRKIPGKPFK